MPMANPTPLAGTLGAPPGMMTTMDNPSLGPPGMTPSTLLSGQSSSGSVTGGSTGNGNSATSILPLGGLGPGKISPYFIFVKEIFKGY